MAEATGARTAKLLTVERVKLMAERVTTTECGLNTVKVHLVETEAALQKSLEALELERKARSEAD